MYEIASLLPPIGTVDHLRNSPVDIQTMIYGWGTAIIIFFVGWNTYFAREHLKETKKMKEILTTVLTDNAVEKIKLDIHIKDESRHCHFPSCREERSRA